MTNEEKAKELANMWSTDHIYNRVKISAMEMAKWKDQQFKEYLWKNRTKYSDSMNGAHDYAMGMREGYVTAFNKIIDELFKED